MDDEDSSDDVYQIPSGLRPSWNRRQVRREFHHDGRLADAIVAGICIIGLMVLFAWKLFK